MDLRINSKSHVPVHVQLQGQIKHLILTGGFEVGSRLPSIRATVSPPPKPCGPWVGSSASATASSLLMASPCAQSLAMVFSSVSVVSNARRLRRVQAQRGALRDRGAARLTRP